MTEFEHTALIIASFPSVALSFALFAYGIKTLRPSLAWQFVKELPLIVDKLKVKVEDGKVKFELENS